MKDEYRCKLGVNLDLSAELSGMLPAIESVVCGAVRPSYPGFVFIITSGRDGKHSEGSKHYSGNAVDVRTRFSLIGQPVYLPEYLRLCVVDQLKFYFDRW